MPRQQCPFVFLSQLQAIHQAELVNGAMAEVHRVLARSDPREPLSSAIRTARHLPPDELLMALRSPATGPRTIRLRCHGRRWRVDVTPNGQASHQQEMRIWEAIEALASPRGPAAA